MPPRKGRGEGNPETKGNQSWRVHLRSAGITNPDGAALSLVSARARILVHFPWSDALDEYQDALDGLALLDHLRVDEPVNKYTSISRAYKDKQGAQSRVRGGDPRPSTLIAWLRAAIAAKYALDQAGSPEYWHPALLRYATLARVLGRAPVPDSWIVRHHHPNPPYDSEDWDAAWAASQKVRDVLLRALIASHGAQ